MNTKTEAQGNFASMQLLPALITTLNKQGITIPTPIQGKAIPVGLTGQDVLGIAQTGTGKTLAFGLPVLQQLDKKGGRALILLPTRELAHQVNDSLRSLCNTLAFSTAVLIGGESMGRQIRDLRQQPEIIIATPGRLMDLFDQGRVNLEEISYLVLDEADRMFDMGFAPQITEIIKHIPKQRQTLLFSATMPESVIKLIKMNMKNPARIEIAPQGTTAANIEQGIYLTKRDFKGPLLIALLREAGGTALVFSRTKHGATKINKFLRANGFTAAEIHSDRSQSQRREALHGFKTGRYDILIATDIAARGIDVPNIGLVINFDLPDNPEDYIHRIGRTGRAGQKGRALSFATPDQRGMLRIIEKVARKPIPLLKMPELPEVVTRAPEHHDHPRRHSEGGHERKRPHGHAKRKFGGGGSGGGGHKSGSRSGSGGHGEASSNRSGGRGKSSGFGEGGSNRSGSRGPSGGFGASRGKKRPPRTARG